ncbi:hypothetical protein H3H37_15660 [Duganella sp. LX20W]|uniref:Uncharacterized protein n=1 Tax=Rugamonas brunnea TaxID=2758569 RepID=A0A7W2ETT4_9BURK|nr:hypothetical protein [Rugamonas brunnea]MBA5638496.1 hypothetical protein [Rugamonas brunnea]
MRTRSRSFLRTLLLTLATGSAACVGLVYLVDPYGLYGAVNRAGINAIKPALTRYQEEIKATNALRSGAANFIFGNSRAEIGFDPDTLGNAYNLAIAGSVMDSVISQIATLRAHGVKPASAIVGMEFLNYAEAPRPVPLLPPSAAPDHPVDRAFWRFDTLYSFTSLKDSLRTLRIQQDAYAETMSPRGFNPLREYLAYARLDGYHLIFQRRAEENAATYLRKARAGFNASQARQDTRRILDLLAASGSDIKLVIYPYHAQVLLLFEETGLWPWFEAWKAILAQEVATARARHPGIRILLADFSGFGPRQCEAVPAEGSSATTHWYWEGGHFKKALGDELLRALATGKGYDGLGMVLDAGTLEANRARIARERAACLLAQPGLLREVRAIVASQRRNVTPA